MLMLISFVGLVAIYCSYVLRSTGTLDDDVIGHYIIARWSWKYPYLFLDIWGRPAFTVLYAPVAVLGLTAVQVWSSLLAGVTAVGSALVAKAYGVRWYWLTVLFTGLQPEFVRQGFASLTELTFALLLCLALLAYKRQRWLLMALAAGFLPLARYENLPILLLFFAILVQKRQYAGSMLLTLPMLVWNSFHAFTSGAWLRLLFPFDRLLGQQATPIVFDYGSGSLFHYLNLLPVAYGGVCFVLFVCGLLHMRFGLLHLCAAITVFVLSISYWALPSTGIAGYIRHLAAIAPVIGVLAVAGLESIGQHTSGQWRKSMLITVLLVSGTWLLSRGIVDGAVASFLLVCTIFYIPHSALFLKIGVLILILMVVTSTLVQVQPYYLTEEQKAVVDAANWYKDQGYENSITFGSHIWFVYAAGIDPLDRTGYRPLTLDEIEKAPAGSLVIWDSHYSDRLIWNVPLETLRASERYKEVRSSKGESFELHMFQIVPSAGN